MKYALRAAALLCALLIFMCGCSRHVSYDDSDALAVAQSFIQLLNDGDYDAAYGLLSSAAQERVTRDDFVKKYDSIFTDLEIMLFRHTGELSYSGAESAVYEYDGVYESRLCGEITSAESYAMELAKENGLWRVDWTPALIFRSMAEGDTIEYSTVKSSRGEIFASDNRIVAQNVPGITVFASTQDIIQSAESERSRKSDNAEALKQEREREQSLLPETGSVNPLEGGGTAKIIETSGRKKRVSTLPDGSTESEWLYTDFETSAIRAFAQKIAPFLSMDADEIAQKIARTYPYLTILKAFRPEDFPDDYRDAVSEIAGAGIDTKTFTTYRDYPLGECMFHITGYVGPITEEELAAYKATNYDTIYTRDSIVGKTGIEKYFDPQLQGVDGKKLTIVSPDGSVKTTLYERKVQNGLDVHLTIDPELQSRTYDLMRLYYRGDQSGACVASDPLTGEIKAMVNYPSLDPRMFMDGLSQSQWESISTDKRAPLLNRALNGLFPPGSIFKPLVAAMGLDCGVLQSDSVFPYEIKRDKWTPDRSDWHYPPITRVENKGGVCDLYNSIVWSDNIFFAWAAMEMGSERFLDYCKKLGFSAEIPFELPVTQSRVYNKNTDFHIKFLADSGYGQGEMLVTPLHANMLIGAVANKGVIMKPYIVSGLWKTEGTGYECVEQTMPEAFLEPAFDPYTLTIVEPMMKAVMSAGTGRSVHSPYETAGKTGTAEKSKIRDISWMSAYKCEGASDFNVTVVIDSYAGEGNIKYELANSMFVYDNEKRKKEAE